MEYFMILFFTGFALTAFLPDTGIITRWKRVRRDKEKILIEDTLKHLYDCEYKSQMCNIDTVMKFLSLSKEKSEKILAKLEAMEFVIPLGGELHLTQTGRAYALRIVRMHRLWEKYLAERTSLDSTIWHSTADQLEHEITESEADKLAAGMGNPLFDPHGDPIPSSSGEVPFQRGRFLSVLEEGESGVIDHIEDEPEQIYSQIANLNLYPGQHIRITKKSSEEIHIIADGEESVLPSEIAPNISVVEAGVNEKLFTNYETLVSLNTGEEGEVIGIAKSCRGMQRRRLMDLGVVPGSRVRAELKSIGGNPIAFNIRGALIALRKENAKQVFIKKIGKVN